MQLPEIPLGVSSIGVWYSNHPEWSGEGGFKFLDLLPDNPASRVGDSMFHVQIIANESLSPSASYEVCEYIENMLRINDIFLQEPVSFKQACCPTPANCKFAITPAYAPVIGEHGLLHGYPTTLPADSAAQRQSILTASPLIMSYKALPVTWTSSPLDCFPSGYKANCPYRLASLAPVGACLNFSL